MKDVFLESLLGYQLKRASAALFSDFRLRLDQTDFSPTLASVLILLKHNSNMNQSEVGNALGIKRANMVPLISKLEKKGWVNRVPIDGRSFKVEITESGLTLVESLQQKIIETEQSFKQLISCEEAEMLLKILPKLWQKEQD
jgi:DNA-binding MarR family transcriptional regulator